ncbi:MAG: serine hydrolase domain-containing protein [Negativicutes bacterium]|jgi:CubicO group peptidase (beta-lactamase class C family)
MKRTLVLCLALIVLLTGLSATVLAATQYDRAIEIARDELTKAIESRAASATVAIMDGDKIVYSEAFGLVDGKHNIPANTDTQFNVNSVSKIFAAAAILLLCEDGKLDLDKPVTTYLPEFKMADQRYKQITVRMLLNSASGMPGFSWVNECASVKNPDYVSQVLGELAESGLKSPPGAVSEYCTDGFTLAQAVVEKTAGMSYADFLSKRVFSKAGMINTSCNFKNGNKNIAVSYDKTDGHAFPVAYGSSLGGAGVSSNALDLCRYAQAVWSGKILNDKSLGEYTRPQYGPLTTPPLAGAVIMKYGLGWDSVAVNKFADQGITVLAKNGATASELYVAPKEGLIVAVCICGPVDVEAINAKIMQALLEDKGYLKPAAATKPPAELADASIPESAYQYEGTYILYGYVLKINFDREHDVVNISAIQSDGSFALPDSLKYKTDGFIHGGSSKLGFGENSLGEFLTVENDYFLHSLVYQKISSDGNRFDTARFADKLWLRRNLAYSDFTCYTFLKTRSLKTMPGYFMVDSNYTIYGGAMVLNTVCWQTSEKTATSGLAYAENTIELSVHESNGKQWLKKFASLFSDGKDTAVLKLLEKIRIDKDGYNEWRIADKEFILDCAVSTHSRIVILSPDMKVVYDSLMNGVKPVTVAKGSYIDFIGSPGAEFVLK